MRPMRVAQRPGQWVMRTMRRRWGLLAALALALAGPATARGTESLDSMAERTRACTACHGEQGRAGPDGYYPRIAGKPAGYLHNQLRNFAAGQRHYEPMARLLATMDDTYMRQIAEHFASQHPPFAPPVPARLPAERRARGEALARRGDPSLGIPACADCHGERLTGVEPHVPGLLGLPLDYLNAQLGAWLNAQRRARPPDCMAEVVRRLPHPDLVAVTGWLASQPVPADARPAPRPGRPPSDPAWHCGSAPELSRADRTQP